MSRSPIRATWRRRCSSIPRSRAPPMLSRRLPPHADLNALTRALATRREDGRPVVDLTESNPTRAGFSYPPDLLAELSSPRALRYEPRPFGMDAAREAVARDHARRGVTIDPGRVVLTASTSEAYTWLFKLLCDPGDTVLVPRPSYPLFEHLSRLEGICAVPFHLEYHGRWEIDFESMDAAPVRTRAIVIVSPNNPTGSFVSARELERLGAHGRARGPRVDCGQLSVGRHSGTGSRGRPARTGCGDPRADSRTHAYESCRSPSGRDVFSGMRSVEGGRRVVGGRSRAGDAERGAAHPRTPRSRRDPRASRVFLRLSAGGVRRRELAAAARGLFRSGRAAAAVRGLVTAMM